jgi:hypothetical protein
VRLSLRRTREKNQQCRLRGNQRLAARRILEKILLSMSAWKEVCSAVDVRFGSAKNLSRHNFMQVARPRALLQAYRQSSALVNIEGDEMDFPLLCHDKPNRIGIASPATA